MGRAGCRLQHLGGHVASRATRGLRTEHGSRQLDGRRTVRPTGGTHGSARYIALSRAGMIGLCGVNDGGVAVLVNTLPQLPSPKWGCPSRSRCGPRSGETSVDEAAQILRSLPHASGQAYTLVSRDKVVGLESGASGTAEYVNARVPRPSLAYQPSAGELGRCGRTRLQGTPTGTGRRRSGYQGASKMSSDCSPMATGVCACIRGVGRGTG